MKEKLKIGIVGLGGRSFYSTGGLTRDLAYMDDVDIVWVCDLYQDRVDDAIRWLKEERGMSPKGTTDYKDILADPEVDAVGVFNGWEMHIQIATDAMKAGKAVGMEVGGAYSVEDCWKLVRTQEETGVFFMLLENCCYGRLELLGLKLARLGIFGEIVHCSGGYHHDLRGEISASVENRHYRLRNYMYRNSHNYPTHDLGPISKVLNINCGNRIVSLSSFASKACGFNEFNSRVRGKDHGLANYKFAQGDIVTTVLKCSNGETIVLTLDTSTPRPYYSRGFTIRGTKAFLTEDTKSLFIEEDMKEEISGLHDM
ncbi:MAG: Gfo/Idh/MocA family oxidoreductase, partial [Clostridia bacterium]|nr:Gfo/Idh/MocA family oxidoreductase [Clostridia bacterium]